MKWAPYLLKAERDQLEWPRYSSCRVSKILPRYSSCRASKNVLQPFLLRVVLGVVYYLTVITTTLYYKLQRIVQYIVVRLKLEVSVLDITNMT